jgi:putative CocE/NonD family hydrolase
MTDDSIQVVSRFPRAVREIENQWIPLADGTRLAARIWLPEDAEQDPVPAILEFLPYRKRDGTAERDALTHPYCAGQGYACVRVDMRGSGESQGILEGEYLKTEQDDALEVLAWIAAQPWCSGNTGMIGISWGGFNSLQVAARRPPSLRAIITIASTDDRYADDIHYMGGVMLEDNMTWGSTMFAFNSRPPDSALVGGAWRDLWMQRLAANDPWQLEWLKYQARDDFWRHGSVCENYGDIECAVYAVGGWADGYSNAVPRLLAGLDCPKKGLVGPWAHKYPHFALPGPRIGFLQETLRWWDQWLKGEDTGVMDEPQYRVWMQDYAPPQTHYLSRPGRWVAEARWPSDNINPLTLYLTDAGLYAEPSAPVEAIIHTPQTMGARQGAWFSFGFTHDAPADQREDDSCSLVFDSAPLTQTLEILGAPVVNLRLSSDRPNGFVVARLNDVSPDGASTRVTYGVLNLTHREGHAEPKALEAGVSYTVRLQLNDAAHSFRAGNRIRVAFSNTLWPMFWPSPQPVTLTLYTGASTLALPTREPRSEDLQLADFEAPAGAPPEEQEQLAPDNYTRHAERDETTGEARLTVIEDDGMTRLTRFGWEHGSISRHYYTIRDGDPNSACLRTHWTTRCKRTDGDLNVRIETYAELSSTPAEFLFSARLEAYEGKERVYEKDWEQRFARYLN